MKRFFVISIAMILFALMALVPMARADQTEEAIEKAAQRNAVVVRLHKEGRIDEALEAAERAYKVTAETLGLKHPSTATALHNLAALFEEIGELRRAEAFFTRALKIREATLGVRHRDTINTRRRLAAIEKTLAGPTAAGEDKRPVKVFENGGPTASGSRSVKIATRPPARIILNGGGRTAPVRSTAPVRPKRVEARVLKAGSPPARANGGSVKVVKNGGVDYQPRMSKNGAGMTGAVGGVTGEIESASGETFETRSFPMVIAENGENSEPASNKDVKFDAYVVKLGVDEVMKIPGPAGLMRVWIGAPEYAPEFREGMAESVGSLPKVGETAKVKAVAPDFEVEPKDSICIKLHPTGADVLFVLRPKKKGDFKVSAVVELFSSVDCSGAAIPKAVKTLSVSVVVDTGKKIGEGAEEMGGIFWEKFLDFWGAIVALFFGLILFLLRGKLKKIFGFSGDKD